MGLLAIIGVILFFLLGSYLFTSLVEEKDKLYASEKLKSRDIALAVAKIVGLVALFLSLNYFMLVKVNLRYTGIILALVLFTIMALALIRKEIKIEVKRLGFISSAVLGASLLIIVILYGILGGRVYLHADAYSKLLDIDSGEFNADVQTVDVTTLPIVDKSYGEKLGTLKLGEYPGIGSEFEAGDYSDILYNNEQYLVAPLEYRGIFKWFNNNDQGTPGYIMINKVTAETRLINLSDTEGYGLKYTPSAYFQQDVTRHAYFNGLSQYNLEATYFEIDDNMHPYYVLQYSLPTIFINGGKDIARIAVVDAVTGETNSYAPEDVPEWVESVYPPSLLLTQLNYWGSLQDGWLNSFLAQRGVLQASSGTRTIKNDDGLFYFTGLTSAGSDESTIGFVYMNIKTKETNLYNFPGATENAAMNKAMTLIPQNNITTSFPIPINVNESPTYFILIKGEDGRIIRQVFMNVQDLELYGIAERKTNAYSSYLLNLGGSNQSNLDTLTGTIISIESYVSEGNTIYWVELDDGELYLINVSTFDIDDMRYFMAKDIGDDIEFKVQEYTIIDFIID